MTTRITFNQPDSLAEAWRQYSKPESKEQWKKTHLSILAIVFFSSLRTLYTLPLFPMLRMIALESILGLLLCWLTERIYTRDCVRKYARGLMARDGYTLILKPEGLDYRYKNSLYLYPWSAITRIEHTDDGFILAQIEDREWVIPPGIFASAQEQAEFIATLEAYRQGEKLKASPSHRESLHAPV